MKIKTSQVTKHLLTELTNLDPISVICENFGPGSGKITIECFGESWSHYWSHMGEQHTLETFFIKASDDYIAGKLCSGSRDESDWEGLPDLIRKEIVKLRRDGRNASELNKAEAREHYDNASSVDNEVAAYLNSDLLCAVFGEDWMHFIPRSRPTHEYNYLMRIIPVVRDALRSITQAQAA